MNDATPRTFVDSVARWGAFLTPVGMVILLALQVQFVSRKEFQEETHALDNRLQHVEIALVQLVEQNKVNDRQDVMLTDHENRLRALEKAGHL